MSATHELAVNAYSQEKRKKADRLSSIISGTVNVVTRISNIPLFRSFEFIIVY